MRTEIIGAMLKFVAAVSLAAIAIYPYANAETALTSEALDVKRSDQEATAFCDLIALGETLNAGQFADGFFAWTSGDLTRTQAINYWNGLISENGGSSLTTAEEVGIDSLKAENDAQASTLLKLIHYEKVKVYLQAVQDERAACAWAEPRIGLD